MILVVTHKTDFTADYVINKFNERNIEYKRLNCEDILEQPYAFSFNGAFTYSILGVEKINSVWFRRTKLPDMNNLSMGDKLYLLQEVDCLLSNLYELVDAKWLSVPQSVYRAENKLHQLKIASEIGWKIPPTIVTNSHEAIRRFFHQHNGDIIIKPLGQTTIDHEQASEFIFTNKVPAGLIHEIDNFDITPSIFQKNIAKHYEIRATVVDNEVFSAVVDSQSDEATKQDWRKKKLEFRPVQLPTRVQDLCKKLIRKLGLHFGAIDLIKTPDDDYIFLEINPNGQWVWIETQTGLGISDSIIKFLNI